MDVEQYIRNLPWSERATDHEKALVEGNLRGFYAEMQKATQPLFDAAVAIELQIDEQTLAERDTRPPPPEPKIMGEEVEEKRCDILEEIRDAKDGYVTRSDLIAIMSDAGKQIESLRASLTRVEEESLAACDKYEQEWRDAAKVVQDPENQALFERFGNIVRNTRHLVAQCLSRADGQKDKAP